MLVIRPTRTTCYLSLSKPGWPSIGTMRYGSCPPMRRFKVRAAARAESSMINSLLLLR